MDKPAGWQPSSAYDHDHDASPDPPHPRRSARRGRSHDGLRAGGRRHHDPAEGLGQPDPSESESVDPCAKETLQTHTPGTLTITTDKPAFEPWFVDDAPENGKGYEGAVAAAVAEQLGFTPDEVTWTRTEFNAAIAPGPKDWDFDINQFSITEKRREAVDFSSPYYDVAQTVVTTGGTEAARATSLADLKGLKIGAQVGTTSYDAILAAIDPSSKPARLQHQRRRPEGAGERSDRRARRRPADRVLHDRRSSSTTARSSASSPPRASRSSSAWCWTRAAR